MICKNRYQEPVATYGQANIIFHIRSLWREMATWIREYLIAKSANLDIADDVFNRLYKVPQEFANSISLIFGDEIAETYMQYLDKQTVLIKEIIDAEIAGNTNLINEKYRELLNAINERAKFVASVNPFWDENVTKNLANTYIQYTLQEVVTYLAQEHQKNIDIYDIILHYADNVGDYFAQGLYNYINYSQNNL